MVSSPVMCLVHGNTLVNLVRPQVTTRAKCNRSECPECALQNCGTNDAHVIQRRRQTDVCFSKSVAVA